MANLVFATKDKLNIYRCKNRKKKWTKIQMFNLFCERSDFIHQRSISFGKRLWLV